MLGSILTDNNLKLKYLYILTYYINNSWNSLIETYFIIYFFSREYRD